MPMVQLHQDLAEQIAHHPPLKYTEGLESFINSHMFMTVRLED